MIKKLNATPNAANFFENPMPNAIRNFVLDFGRAL